MTLLDKKGNRKCLDKKITQHNYDHTCNKDLKVGTKLVTINCSLKSLTCVTDCGRLIYMRYSLISVLTFPPKT